MRGVVGPVSGSVGPELLHPPTPRVGAGLEAARPAIDRHQLGRAVSVAPCLAASSASRPGRARRRAHVAYPNLTAPEEDTKAHLGPFGLYVVSGLGEALRWKAGGAANPLYYNGKGGGRDRD